MNLTESILESLSTSVVVLDQNLKLRYMNTAAENLTATSLHHAQGNSITFLFNVTNEWLEELRQVFVNTHPFTRRQMDLELVSGERHLTVDYTAAQFVDSEQQLFLLLEIQPIDRLLRISKEEALVSSEQTSRNLIRGLAHEIKNPLGGIRGAAQLLAREFNDAGLEDYTNVIIEESDRLRNLVDRMLGSNKPLQLESMNVHEVLERVINLVNAETGQKIELQRDYDPSIPDLAIDREQMIQTLLNIVRNAMQSLTNSDVEDRKIILRTRIQRNFTIGKKQHRLLCRIDVVDNGPGIPEDILGDIFYPMISGRPDGTGLGLAISQSVVVQHKGLIECESAAGKTVFSIFLPLEK